MRLSVLHTSMTIYPDEVNILRERVRNKEMSGCENQLCSERVSRGADPELRSHCHLVAPAGTDRCSDGCWQLQGNKQKTLLGNKRKQTRVI